MINFTTAILFIKKYWRSIALFLVFAVGVVCCLYIWTINNQRKLDRQRISCLESELSKVTASNQDAVAHSLGVSNDNVPSMVQPKEIKKASSEKKISKNAPICEKNNESNSKDSVDHAVGYDSLNDRPGFSFSNNDCDQDQAFEQLLNEMMSEEPCQNNVHDNNAQHKALADSTGDNERNNLHGSESSSQASEHNDANGFARSNDDFSDVQSQNSNSKERQATRDMLDENIEASKRELLRIQAEQVKEQCKAEINRKIREQISGSVQ